MRLRHPIQAVLAFSLATLWPLAAGQERSDESMLARIDLVVDEALAGSGATGVAVAVQARGEPLLERCYGSARADQLFHVGALCEPFVAVALLRLAQDGALELDEDVSKVLPGLAWEGARVRVRDLLAHTSGVPTYESFVAAWRSRTPGGAAVEEAGAKDEIEAIVSALASLPLESPPGTCFAYDHANDLLCSALLVRLHGKPLAACLAELVFEPLDMERTSFRWNDPGTPQKEDEREIAGEPIALPGHADLFGEPYLCSTSGDLLRWMEGLSSGALLDETRWRAFTEPTVLADGEVLPFGLGIGRSALDEHRALTCGGALAGQRVHVAHYPDLEVTAVVLADGEHAPAARIERRVVRAILDLPEPGVHDWPLAREDLARYAGDYQIGCTRVAIGIDGAHLTFAWAGEPLLRLLHQGRHVFVAGADPEIRLEFELQDGRASGFTLDDHGLRSVAVRFGD